jgi:hypothetical protein
MIEFQVFMRKFTRFPLKSNPPSILGVVNPVECP